MVIRETTRLPKGRSHHIVMKLHNISRIKLSDLHGGLEPKIKKIGMSLGNPEKNGLIFSSVFISNKETSFPNFHISDLVYTPIYLLFECDEEVELKIVYTEPESSLLDGKARLINSWSASYNRPEEVLISITSPGVAESRRVDSSMVLGQRAKKISEVQN